MQNNLSQNILSTIAYYDVLEYPLTNFEIWKFLFKNSDSEGIISKKKVMLIDVIEGLANQELEGKIEASRGYYFLPGRKNLVSRRIENNKISEKKYRSIKKAAWLLQLVPFVRIIFVTGRMALKNARKGSDLDFLIILKKGHIFTGRFLVTGLLHLLAFRRHGTKIADRICLNHFLTDEFCMEVRDLFSAREYLAMLPIFNAKETGDFYRENVWIGEQVENFLSQELNLKVVTDSFFAKKLRYFGESFLTFFRIEDFLQKIQTKKIAENILTRKRGAVIICSEKELAFWPNFENQGPRVFEDFKERLGEGLVLDEF